MSSENVKCGYIPATPYVMAGWGCCKCRVYNGVWRKKCRACGHTCCISLPEKVVKEQEELVKEMHGGVLPSEE